jgi:hypothetical protein
MVILVVVTAVASAALDNVTTVLLIAPVTFLVCDRLGVPPVPFLIAEYPRQQHRRHRHPGRRPTEHHHRQPRRAVLHRLPGPSRAAGDRAHAGVHRAVPGHVPVGLHLRRIQGRSGHGAERAGGDPRPPTADDQPRRPDGRDRGVRSAHRLHLDPSVVALVGGLVLLALSRLNADDVARDVEWPTLIFFAGLFIMVGALVKTGVIDQLAGAAADAAEGGDGCQTQGWHASGTAPMIC